MRERNKRITAGCLIAGGIALIAFNFLRSSPANEKVYGQKVEQRIVLDSLLQIKSSAQVKRKNAAIVALFVLKSDVCPPCINNTIDYITMINSQYHKKMEALALFIGAEPEKVRRFVKITQMAIPYRIAKKKQLSVWLQYANQEVIFIDQKHQEIFYRVPIPGNTTTPLAYKKNVLAQAITYQHQLK